MALEQARKRQMATVTRTNGTDGRRHGSSGIRPSVHTAAGEDFASSFSQLQDAVRRACAMHGDWEARVVAGIRAAIDFAVESPARAEAVTLNARRGSDGLRGS